MASAFIQVCLLWCVCLSLCSAQAPGDEAARCTTDHNMPPEYPDNERTLMDSYSYVNLLPGNGTGQPIEEDAVWIDMSYDDNDINNTLFPTYWQQGAGGICRYQVRVCGFKLNGMGPVVTQNNWLFTQHINKDFDHSIYNYPVDIWVEITYAGQSCRRRNGCNPEFSLLTYITDTPQLPSILGDGFMNRNNYGNNVTIEPERTSVTYTEIHNFKLEPNEMGLYLAVHDYGTCLGISRLRVYRNNCQGRQIGLVVYPDAPAPMNGSDPVNIKVNCVDNAVFTSSSSDQVECDSDGIWGSDDSECQCSPGYTTDVVSNIIQCNACPAGEYGLGGDSSCQQCPDNTDIDVVAAPVCECLPGYFRNDVDNTPSEANHFVLPADERPSDDCTSPPDASGDLTVVAVSAFVIQASWLPSSDNGGRTDLFYQVEHSDPDNLGSYTGTVYLSGDTTSHTFTGLRPYTQYCVRVIAHNGVSDQDPEGTHLRTVQDCVRTPEAEPGPVIEVEGHCSVVVWNQPDEPNGVILNYTLLFYLNGGNDSGVLVETTDDTTNFVIKPPFRLPLITDDLSLFIKVRARNGKGLGDPSDPAYIGCVDPPGDLGSGVPPLPPFKPEPVVVVEVAGDLVVWDRPPGRISYYIVAVYNKNGKEVFETTTNEQFIEIPEDIKGSFEVEVCTVLDEVPGDCRTFQLDREESCDSSSESSSTQLTVTVVACCLGTALLVGTVVTLIAMCCHWRLRKQFGENKKALTWEAYEMKT